MKMKGWRGSQFGLVIAVSIMAATGAAGAPTKIITGPDTGFPGPQINTYSPGGTPNGSFFADTSGFTGGLRVALANVVSTNDIITGTGPGSAPLVRVFTGRDHTLLYSIVPYATNFTQGVYVAGGDINGDGRADIIVGPGTSSAPNVKAFSGANGSTLLANFLAFGPSFSGGVRVASGDVNGDGRADIIAGTGPGAAQVTVFSGESQSVLRNFFAYSGFTGGVYVAAGDVNGDGIDDIITGAGTGAALVKVFSGTDLIVLRSFFAFPSSNNGVRVAATDLNGDGRTEIIAASGPGELTRLAAFHSETLEVIFDIVPYGVSTAGVFPGAIPRFPAQSLNLATRANILTGDNALIGGFIINGNDQKNVIIRAIGPSSGVPGALADPTLELFVGSTLVATNNNWRDTQESVVQQTGLAPSNDLESAIVRLLSPGAYTAVVRGNGGTTGIGLVEAYDLNAATTNSQLANLSTRGFVQAGNNVMIAGLILGGGTGANRILARALGPSLTQFGVQNALPDPTLGLYDSHGTLLRSNSDWRQNQEAEILATGLAPSNNLEAALIDLLPPGNYTAIVSGTGSSSGVSLVEAYNLQ